MPSAADRQRFRNEDLLLKVSPAVDRAKWDESRYEGFIDELCGHREYQKEAIQVALRYFLGGEFADLRALARWNYDTNPALEARYGSLAGMERHLQLPDRLAASLDLATGTGKSYILYGIAAILLAEGAVNRVLVLCPSTTIEAGLLDKFRSLAGNSDLRDLLPDTAAISAPHVANASETIGEGGICIENYHAILQHVGSSIRESLIGRGERTAILNDEAHHVANEADSRVKKWKQFLIDPDYGFRYILGVSGTCYVKDDYFADVIYRYSLRQASEQAYVKQVHYIADMTAAPNPDEKWQLINNRHEDNRRTLKSRRLRPLTIVVTRNIARCEDVAEELRDFLTTTTGVGPEKIDEKVLVVYNGSADVARLASVDRANSKVEWIVSVSMLNEGWDVKRVFQIVPHEERAFNSKLLIAQVLGRGLRIPTNWTGEQPVVTVFNHDAWASSIRQLVNEVMDTERRLTSHAIEESPFHFDLHNIDYTLEAQSVIKPMHGPYELFAKGYVDMATEPQSEDVTIRMEEAVSGHQRDYQTRILHETFTCQEVALCMFSRLEDAQDPHDPDPKMRTVYTDKWPVERLQEIVSESLKRVGVKKATESMKQAFLQSLGTLRRKESQNVRYTLIVDGYTVLPTRRRPAESVSANELKTTKTLFYTDTTRASLTDEERMFFDEIAETASGFKCFLVPNHHDFKTPMNAVIADSDNEKRFITGLLQPANLASYDAWVKSTPIRFYEIDYAWKKVEHPKRGKFSPDFFIKVGDLILVVEIKGDEELRDPSPENIKKNEYAVAHFDRVNDYLKKRSRPLQYKLTFLTPRNFSAFFQSLREAQAATFRSELDVRLAE